MYVFVGVILSVFKRSVACPGHGFLQHVYGVTITCSSLFLHQKGHHEVLLRVQSGRPAILLLDVVHNEFHESALGAFSVSVFRSFACPGHAHSACLWCRDPLLPSFAYIGSFVFCRKGERFNELLLDRVLGKDRVGAWKALDPMKSANLVVNAMTGAILLKCLTAHTSRGNVQRGFDLVLETMVDDALPSCVRGLPKLKHVEPLSQLLNRLSCMTSNDFAPLVGSVIKSSGHLGGMGWACVLWKQLNARALRPGPATCGCIAEGLVMNGQPDEALKLSYSHSDSEELYPSSTP